MSIRRNSGLGTWRAFVLAAVAIAAGGVLLSGQITVPNTFVNGTVADAPQVNANFNTLATNALNRTGGTMTGTLTTQAVLPSADTTYALGSGAFRYTTGNFSGLVTAGSFAGTGAALTTLSAANISAGILASARGGVGIDASAPTDGQLLVGKTSDGSWNKATITAGSGISVTNGAGTVTVANTSTSVLTKLTCSADSGTDTSAAATNVATCAISGLTAKDSLLVYATIGSTTQQTSGPSLFNSTDSATLLASGSAIAAGNSYTFSATIRQRQTSGLSIVSAGNVNNTDASGNPFTTNKSTTVAFTTLWTGSWTLALRHGGVTAGGTFDYSWGVYKLAGQ